ncbi:hypothetical protein chiPu_0004422 [Chiloscyllium punctatum]|uniref:Uncharacterized protein n=1 Tax=Chiloscyllium punctatum TaxID=137246 RepID=A0A401S6K5_CHIPU|nr:hypothetical protein [Chiloscyllium punctatum]
MEAPTSHPAAAQPMVQFSKKRLPNRLKLVAIYWLIIMVKVNRKTFSMKSEIIHFGSKKDNQSIFKMATLWMQSWKLYNEKKQQKGF